MPYTTSRRAGRARRPRNAGRQRSPHTRAPATAHPHRSCQWLSFAKNASADMALSCNAFIAVMQGTEFRDLDDPPGTRDLPSRRTLPVEPRITRWRLQPPGVTEKVAWHVVKEFARKAGVTKLAPHDLRRTRVRLCRAAGGELEQIWLLMGHVSVQTTERYLGCTQRIGTAVMTVSELNRRLKPGELWKRCRPSAHD